MGRAQRYVYDLATNLPHSDFEPIAGESGRLSQILTRRGRDASYSFAWARCCSYFRHLSFFQMLIYMALTARCDHLNSSKAAALGAL